MNRSLFSSSGFYPAMHLTAQIKLSCIKPQTGEFVKFCCILIADGIMIAAIMANMTKRTNATMLKYPIIKPTSAMPSPARLLGSDLIFDLAIWPQIMAGTPVTGPHVTIESMPSTSDHTANGWLDFMEIRAFQLNDPASAWIEPDANPALI
ncbi:MAG: hypothetical protein PHP98_03855 [Kiritimatiellae bacterium]|nr:hypothetical protein [Kiritimatiellia bacterium]